MANFFKVTPKKQQVGHEVNVNITRLDFNGCGVGKYHNKPIFIEGTLVGENVSVKVIEQKNKYSRGKLLDVLAPSGNRVVAKCQHYLSCGGCDIQHIKPSAQLDFKQQKITELFARHGYVSLLPWEEPVVSEPWHYRRKARIGVQYDKAGQVTVGFRQRGSNQLINIKNCVVLVEPLNKIFVPLKKLLAKLSGKNAIGHIEVISTDKLTVVVRQLEKITDQDKQNWQAFSENHSCEILMDNGKAVTSLFDNTVTPLTYDLDDNINIFLSS
jgi:23S rRNA (uracil1939-C5)-methyltransferase